MILDTFDRCVILNLRSRGDRLAKLFPELVRAGIDPRECVVSQSEIPETSPNGLPKTKWGCRLAHVNAVADANLDGLDSILVLEDDLLFRHDFQVHWKNVKANLDQVEWSIFSMGCSVSQYAPDLEPCLHRLWEYNLGHAYAVHRRGFENYIRMMASKAPIAHDHTLNLLAKIEPSYVSEPYLCWQRDDFSDIEGKDISWINCYARNELKGFFGEFHC